MSLANRAFVFATSKIPFLCANMNESYKAELLVIDALSKRKVAHPKSQKILSVGSSGETALALCSHPCVKQVYCYEWRDNQSHFIEMRRTSLLHLPMDDIKVLYGIAQHDEERESQTAKRLEIFDRLVKRLPQESYDFWMKHRDTAVKFGLMHTGKCEAVYSNIRKSLLNAGFDNPVENFQKYGGDDRFYKAFSNPPTAQEPNMTENDKHFHARIASLLSSGLKKMYQGGVDISKNYLVTLVLRGTFAFEAGDQGFPLVFTEQGQKELVQLGITPDRLRILGSNVFDFGRKERYFHFITISNVYDNLLSEEESRRALMLLKDSLAEGGLLLLRNSFGKSLRHLLHDVGLKIDEKLTKEAKEVDESALLGTRDSLLVLENEINLDKESHEI